jgi:hypothetical protein
MAGTTTTRKSAAQRKADQAEQDRLSAELAAELAKGEQAPPALTVVENGQGSDTSSRDSAAAKAAEEAAAAQRLAAAKEAAEAAEAAKRPSTLGAGRITYFHPSFITSEGVEIFCPHGPPKGQWGHATEKTALACLRKTAREAGVEIQAPVSEQAMVQAAGETK